MKGWGQDFHFAKLRLLKSLEHSKSVLCNEIFTCAKPAILLVLALIISLSVDASWLQQSQKRPTTKSVTCTLWIVHTVPHTVLQNSQITHNPCGYSWGCHTAWLLSSITSCLSRWSKFAASASDHLCNPDDHFLYSLPYVIIAFPPQLVHHNKSSVPMNSDNPDCHLLNFSKRKIRPWFCFTSQVTKIIILKFQCLNS